MLNPFLASSLVILSPVYQESHTHLHTGKRSEENAFMNNVLFQCVIILVVYYIALADKVLKITSKFSILFSVFLPNKSLNHFWQKEK